jgi:hypothetical protein
MVTPTRKRKAISLETKYEINLATLFFKPLVQGGIHIFMGG